MKIICMGLNYRKHCVEMGWQFPTEPVVFLKPDSALLKKNKPFFLPGFSDNIHYEVEVVIKISKLGKGIAAKFAHRYYNEITVGIDLTARDIQGRHKKAGLPWEISKGFDGAAPVGTFIPVSSIGNINNVDFSLKINDIEVQKSNTSDLIFGVDKIIEYVSKFFTLKTGDIVFTGTPSGVGQVKRNDNLVAYLDGKPLLDFMIR
ncbi:MAG: 2-hydroxyhepta-2,4-diene-1,7-dioate isomerase [Bacteroidetes bacterium GWE2_41_25]|nr:MAG: 2-hydroxyhepta-2,4-diene-1,7-dioate isomerase [Bacteroidetes bacterium GWA2_40_15]OFX91921.1 MAG: 2-hydroxyhepta-2,4-diene-1,7-dioate isomerase [Bacteroidetes bacterium GWE2_41_25]OFX95678.1 MAG: 2-hydroxyhepta-2,4-diene-1,7-dioate isomerase [Bacteroidetes bacterium GWC2_40_22]OFY57431.1 MAG: 2-hydroxyhepta-2,4-diene-1,7-dioate isomerase [Bacteroidetes bacterium GWF2_41_9]HAM09341.1 2-hydroxyhepta-2,4-diene-1,7-dioate isomerase [Bacteroidales bacterium]